MHPRVDLPDGSHTLVPEGGDEGADGDVHYVAVEQDLDQSPEGPRPTLLAKASPESLTSLFKIMQLPLLCLCIEIPRYLCSFTSMLGL
jgi:hypothetical protein